jgi:two-component system sensor kinase FixL
MSPEDTTLPAELEERLRFETLLADLSSKFVNLPAGEVDREIMDAQRRICELLDLDLLMLWQRSGEALEFFSVTHFYSAQQGPESPERLKEEDYPWFKQELVAGRIAGFASLEELPAEAARDRESFRQLGTKSNLSLPLLVGGGPLIGAFCLNATRAERDWPDALVKRLQLVAQIFANALARKRTDRALRESEGRLQVVADLARLGCYEINYAEPSLFVDDRFGQICGMPSGKHQGLQRLQFWIEHLHPDDRQRVLEERQKMYEGNERYDIEYRYLHPAQGQKWIHHLGCVAARDATGRVLHVYGVVQDITDRKQTDEELQRLRLHLWHADRVAQTGAITASLAHELNQPLTAILSNAQAGLRFMDGGNPELGEIRAILTDIVQDDKRAGAVIGGLRNMLRRRETQRERINLRETIEEVLFLVHSELVGQQVELREGLDPDSPVLADQGQVQQVILNLPASGAWN